MLATNHGLTGMIIGATLSPVLAVPVAFASHFLLDTIPHYGIKKSKRNRDTFYKKVVFIDTFIALSFAVLTATTKRWDMFWIGWVAYAPDGYWVYLYFKQKRSLNLEITSRFGKFHESIQKEFNWGLLVEVPLAVSLIILFVHLFMH